MKIVKRIVLAVLIVSIGAIVFRGWIFRELIVYHSIGHRDSRSITNEKLAALIESNMKPGDNRDIYEIIELSLSITADHLAFKAEKSDIDPNLLVDSRSTHCVGYAHFLVTTLNFILDKYSLSENWFAMSHIGQLYLLGENIHNYIDYPFFKNHDFVVIKNKKTGETIAVDPVVNDYFKIDTVSFKERNSGSNPEELLPKRTR